MNTIKRRLHWSGWRQDWHRLRIAIQRTWRFFIAGFIADKCAVTAGALTYTSLLSVVPLMAVTFSVLAAFPVFQSVTADMQAFVFENFVPAAGAVVSEHLQSFAQKASQLTVAGIVFLMLTAVMLMANIDGALNGIFKVRTKRKVLASFLVYWAVLTLGPLLLGASLVMTSFLVSAPLFDDAAATFGGRARLLTLAPFLAEALAFGLLYMVVPNRPIRWWHAFSGGVLAAVLFEAAKRAFAWYVTNFPTYEAIYGALAAIPIFLIWIYLSWLVVLVGAEFTQTLSKLRYPGQMAEGRAPSFLLSYRLMDALWKRQEQGETQSSNALARDLEVDVVRVTDVLESLETARVVARTEVGNWFLLRDLGRYTLRDLYDDCDPTLPRFTDLANSDAAALQAAIKEVDAHIENVFGQPLASYFKESV